jgi:hypothetical protein
MTRDCIENHTQTKKIILWQKKAEADEWLRRRNALQKDLAAKGWLKTVQQAAR